MLGGGTNFLEAFKDVFDILRINDFFNIPFIIFLTDGENNGPAGIFFFIENKIIKRLLN